MHKSIQFHNDIFAGHTEVARLLLARDPGLLQLRDGEGQTALHYAASCGHPALVTALIEAGADPAICDNDGLAPCNQDTDPDIAKLFRLKLE